MTLLCLVLSVESTMNKLSAALMHPIVVAIATLVLWVMLWTCISVIGILHMGGVMAWFEWRRDHAWLLFAWRMCLYAAVAYGLWWRRQQVLKRNDTPKVRARLHRVDLLALFTMAMAEVHVDLRQL